MWTDLTIASIVIGVLVFYWYWFIRDVSDKPVKPTQNTVNPGCNSCFEGGEVTMIFAHPITKEHFECRLTDSEKKLIDHIVNETYIYVSPFLYSEPNTPAGKSDNNQQGPTV